MPINNKTSELTEEGPNFWVKNYADYLYNYARTRIDDNDLASDWFRRLSSRH